uniref:Uncharacterized protein n=1 Tax=Pithovirus LCDPAC01 TaxID=2506600 RepID=A0A481YMP9_9VIRU|nr:MAG: hypothetical protein LCDPAC01_00890 [Pithovirus LCDPAC01]
MAKIATSALIITIVIFVIMIVGLLAFLLVYMKRSEKAAEAIGTQNPFCARVVCSDKKDPRQVPLTDDPQKGTYLTLNYCINNAPSINFQKALEKCGSDASSPEHTFFHSDDRIKTISDWYSKTYSVRCGYGWDKSSSDTTDTITPLINTCLNNT